MAPKNPELGDPPNPTNEKLDLMSFVRWAMASICFRYSSVYWTEAPSGATTKVKKNPRSSAGTNSCSSALYSSTADAVSNTPPAITIDGRRNEPPNKRTYPLVTAPSAPCTTWWNRDSRVETRRIFADSMGVSVSATIPEMSTEPPTATPNSLNNRPVAPVRNSSGEKTATSAIVVAITAVVISFVPSMAAVSGSFFSSSWWR